jgi:hypothetical protein
MSQNEERVVLQVNNKDSKNQFHFIQNNMIAVFGYTKDKDLLFEYRALNLISKSFQESLVLNDNHDGRKFMGMKDTNEDIIVEALSFYYPRFNKI